MLPPSSASSGMQFAYPQHGGGQGGHGGGHGFGHGLQQGLGGHGCGQHGSRSQQQLVNMNTVASSPSKDASFFILTLLSCVCCLRKSIFVRLMSA